MDIDAVGNQASMLTMKNFNNLWWNIQKSWGKIPEIPPHHESIKSSPTTIASSIFCRLFTTFSLKSKSDKNQPTTDENFIDSMSEWFETFVIIRHHFSRPTENQQVSRFSLIIQTQFSCRINVEWLTLYIGVPQKSLTKTFFSGVCCLKSRLSFIALMSSKTKPQSRVL